MSPAESHRTKEISMDEIFLKRIKDYVLKNISSEEFSFESLSSEIAYSRSQINRKLKKITGKSLSVFVREIRLEEALRLLKANAGTASDIAYLTGFGSPAYFNKCFHNYFGITPGEVRKQDILKARPFTKVEKAKAFISTNAWKIISIISLVVIIGLVLVNVIIKIEKNSDISRLEKTFAVLPFENFSANENNSYLGNAIANEISVQLVNIKEFQVRSFTSCLNYKGSNKPSMPQIGFELNANFILEGTIELKDQEVTINVQLIQAENDKHLWAKEYDGEWSKIHKIRANIAIDVANEVEILLSQEEIDLIETRPTENLQAYEYYMRGNDFYSRSYEGRDWNLAERNYQKAIELDQDFALAYIKLAITHISIYWFGHDYSQDRLNKCKKAIDAAFDLDPDIAEGYLALGLYYYYGFYDYSKALKQFEIALGYDSDNSECIYYKGCVCRRMGEFRKSLELMENALSIDPRNHSIAINLAMNCLYYNEYNKALKYCDLSINLNPEFAPSYWLKAKVFLKWEGNITKARESLDEAIFALDLFEYSYLVELLFNLNIYEDHLVEALNLLDKSRFEVFSHPDFYYPKEMLYAKIYDIMDLDKSDYYYEQAQTLLENKILQNPNDPRYYISLGICYATMGYKNEAIETGYKALDLWPISKDPISGVVAIESLALIYTMVGESELALERLDYLLSNPGFLSAKLLQLDPQWKALWKLPEFQELISKHTVNY